MVKNQKHRILDEHLFRQEMGDVVPLKTSPKTESRAQRPAKRRHGTDKKRESSSEMSPSASAGTSYIDPDNHTSHRKNGVQKKQLQKLKRGNFPVSGQLDLHHMTMQSACKALLEFISSQQGTTLKCIRIIHGKGIRSENEPRLKPMTWQVLRDHPQVLAFTLCKPANGGSGAVDVLLRSI